MQHCWLLSLFTDDKLLHTFTDDKLLHTICKSLIWWPNHPNKRLPHNSFSARNINLCYHNFQNNNLSNLQKSVSEAPPLWWIYFTIYHPKRAYDLAKTVVTLGYESKFRVGTERVNFQHKEYKLEASTTLPQFNIHTPSVIVGLW